jgi:hypothetical protein
VHGVVSKTGDSRFESWLARSSLSAVSCAMRGSAGRFGPCWFAAPDRSEPPWSGADRPANGPRRRTGVGLFAHLPLGAMASTVNPGSGASARLALSKLESAFRHSREASQRAERVPVSAKCRSASSVDPVRLRVVRSGHEISGDTGCRSPRQSKRRGPPFRARSASAVVRASMPAQEKQVSR